MAHTSRPRNFTLGKAALLFGLMAVAVVLRGEPQQSTYHTQTAGDFMEQILPAVLTGAEKDCDTMKTEGVDL